MRLIGSLQEIEFRNELLSSCRSLHEDPKLSTVRSAIINEGHEVSNSAIIDWIPDQGEDTLTILIYPDSILVMNVERMSTKTALITHRLTLKDYRQGLSRIYQLKILVALDILSKNEIKGHRTHKD